MSKPRVLITTVPFARLDPKPIEILEAAGIEAVINPLDRKLRQGELPDMIKGFDGLVAGTEQISGADMDAAGNLKTIVRVGIGLDSVDLLAARQRDIALAYTPDAPSAAVGELTIGLMVDLLRGTVASDRKLRRGEWYRIMGKRISEITIGIIGVGRIGHLLIGHLAGGFPGVRILANDLAPDMDFGARHDVTWVDKETIYKESDITTLHVPLTAHTRGLIGKDELSQMKPSAYLINTARGGIVDEADLASALRDGTIAGAAIDVFENEPYTGELIEIENSVLTCHMGSMSEDCRARMEIEACEEIARFFTGQAFLNPVPEDEYENAARMKT